MSECRIGRAGGQALREHGGQALLLPEVRTAAHVPGHDLLAGHVVHGSEVRLGAGDLELGDVGAEPGERTGATGGGSTWISAARLSSGGGRAGVPALRAVERRRFARAA